MNDAPPTDHELLEAFRDSRSDEAFGRLVARHGDFVRAVALRRVFGDHHLAEDVAQAVFIGLARRVKQAAASASVRGWLHATTCFAASNACRAKARQVRLEMRADLRPAAIADDPAAVAADADEWAAIDAALCALRRADRDAIMLHYADGRSLPEVATAMGTTLEAAKKRVQRSRERLRRLLSGSADHGIDRLPALIAAPLAPIGPMPLAGGAHGGAFALADRVLSALRLQAFKVAATITAVGSIAAGAVAVAIAQLPDRPSPPPAGPPVVAAAVPVQIAASLADDVQIELVGICSMQDPTQWWGPDGSPLVEPPGPAAALFTGAKPPALKPMDFEDFRVAFRITHRRPTSSALGLDVQAVQYSAHGARWEGAMTVDWPARSTTAPARQPANASPAEVLHYIQLNAAEYSTNCDLRVSVDSPFDQPWETLEAIDTAGDYVGDRWTLRTWTADQDRDAQMDREGAYLNWATPVERDGVASVEVFDDFYGRERTVVAIDRNGVEHPADPPEIKTRVITSPTTAATMRSTELARPSAQNFAEVRHYTTRARFTGLKLADVERFEFRLRSRPALEFSEVALAPGANTNARVGPADPPRVVRGIGFVSRSADQPLNGAMSFDGERLDEAVAQIAQAFGLRIDVHWAFFAGLQRGGRERRVRPVYLTNPSAEVALRAVFSAASFNDIGVVISDDGRTIRVLSSDRMLRSDGRVWQPGRSR